MTVIPFPRTAESLPLAVRQDQALHDARQVATRPDVHTRRVLLDACDVLASWGDWLDVQRATELRRAIRREDEARAPWFAAAESPTIRLPWWGWCLLGAAALAVGIARPR